MNACDARDRLRFMPLAKEWLAKGITFDQMDEAVEEARRTTKKPIGYLPAYAWQVLCNGQAPQRQSKSTSRLGRQAEVIGQLTGRSTGEVIDG